MNEAPEENFGSSEADGSPPYRTKRLTPEAKRENMRGWLAAALFWLLALTVLASFIMLWVHPEKKDELHDWLNLIFSPLVALFGAATGYYYGTQSVRKD